MAEIQVNGRPYLLPQQPTVIICFDGCDPAYLDRGFADRILPTFVALRSAGFVGTGSAVVPTFTNPNNASIVTGVPPAIHGISGNYVLDRATGQARMITDASLMRCGTILAAMADADVKVAAITAKDKLLRLLARDLRGIAFSSEHADIANRRDNGIDGVEAMVGRPKPDQYSADLSLFVLEAGLHLLRQGKAELLYLSLSDYVQHAYAPGVPEADSFMRGVDDLVMRMIEAGAVVGVVADHGMNDKAAEDGTPNVIYLQEELNARFGATAVTVICPITDPFVRHHGALGSFVRVYLQSCRDLAGLMAAAASLPGVDEVLDGAAAARRFELPLDLEGDFIVCGDAGTVIGSSHEDHDLSGLAGHRLRSHGGLAEQRVPIILSRPLIGAHADRAATGGLRNFDIFDLALNGAVRG